MADRAGGDLEIDQASNLTYPQLVRELFPRLTGGIRWGLERTLRLLASVGNPHLRYPTFHVGGTNGKGSVAATIASVLRASGQSTGLYTSPHLCSFTERIQLDGKPISEDALLAAGRKLWPAVRREEPSFFEATTAIAFLVLADAKIDVGVIEVGLGGRLDATNVVRPVLSVLTNVAMDHAEYLGNDLESIATEKAGIVKASVPVVTAERDPAVLRVFSEHARQVGSELHVLEPSDVDRVDVRPDGTRLTLKTEYWGVLDLSTPLIGEHQAWNAALAVRALEIAPSQLRPDRDAVVRGVSAVRWPARLQIERIHGVTWAFDVAHNPAGVESLVNGLRALQPARPLVVVVGILGDKDWERMLPPLFALADQVVLTVPPTAPSGRRWDPRAVLDRIAGRSVMVIEDFDEALRSAFARAGGSGQLILTDSDGPGSWPSPGDAPAAAGTVVVTGSFHTVGDALLSLGRPPW